jgi:hypothetical protein
MKALSATVLAALLGLLALTAQAATTPGSTALSSDIQAPLPADDDDKEKDKDKKDN